MEIYRRNSENTLSLFTYLHPFYLYPLVIFSFVYYITCGPWTHFFRFILIVSSLPSSFSR